MTIIIGAFVGVILFTVALWAIDAAIGGMARERDNRD